MDENMDTDIAQAQVMLQLRQMTISREQTSASLPAIASSESVLSLASVSSMSQADSGMGSDSDKVSFLDLLSSPSPKPLPNIWLNFFDLWHGFYFIVDQQSQVQIHKCNYRRNLWRVIMKTLRFQKGQRRSNSKHILVNHLQIKSMDSHTFSRGLI